MMERPLPDNTQQSQEADTRARGEIRTRNPSKLPAVDPRLRQFGHWNRPKNSLRELVPSLVTFVWF